MLTLVCGLPGVGKTTWVMEHLQWGDLCYDLDVIAGALRLTEPKVEDSHEARVTADELLVPFLKHACVHAENVYVIRTAPPPAEVQTIHPDRIVVIKRRSAPHVHNENSLIYRLVDVMTTARASGIPYEEIFV